MLYRNRIETWHPCTVPPLIYIYIYIIFVKFIKLTLMSFLSKSERCKKPNRQIKSTIKPLFNLVFYMYVLSSTFQCYMQHFYCINNCSNYSILMETMVTVLKTKLFLFSFRFMCKTLFSYNLRSGTQAETGSQISGRLLKHFNCGQALRRPSTWGQVRWNCQNSMMELQSVVCRTRERQA